VEEVVLAKCFKDIDLGRLFKSAYWSNKTPTFLHHDEEQKVANNQKPFDWKSIYAETKDHDKKKWKLNQVFGEDPSSVNEGIQIYIYN
jgi:hypothetical protein